MIRQFRANCIQLVSNFPTGFRIRIIQKPECQTHDVFPGSELSHSMVNIARWLTRRASFGQAGQRGPEFPEGLPGRGGLPECACFTLSESNMVGPSPLCPTPRHIVASTFRCGVALAIVMRILDKNEFSVLLGHREGARSRVLGPAARSGSVHTTIICPCDERPRRQRVSREGV